MFKKVVKYTDFNGNEKSRSLYFHISMSDAHRMIMEESVIVRKDDTKEHTDDNMEVFEGLSSRIRAVMDRGIGKEILELFDWLIQKSYGEIAEDGETFKKSPGVYENWKSTASYDAFFNDLMTDTNAMTEFVNNIFPKEMREMQDPEFKSHQAALDARRGL